MNQITLINNEFLWLPTSHQLSFHDLDHFIFWHLGSDSFSNRLDGRFQAALDKLQSI